MDTGYVITRKRPRDPRGGYLHVTGGGPGRPAPTPRPKFVPKPKTRSAIRTLAIITPRPEAGRARRKRLAQRLRAQGLTERQIAKTAIRRPR